ncbi:hypothetical protein HPB49_013685 [Dermacentor silvarum]|uniref:Uncharacterized protein n=1 Tax=Dermacentor silvarum TaxID=543639 RepID=A0ACB8D5P9_DERSI|nr:hypothetical protein HPB49_013685 [Dermacentor silvarum]
MNASPSLMHLSTYAQNLESGAKVRYVEKVELCGGVDPLMLTGKEASFDLALVPKVELSDIKDYLVHATSFITHEQLKARKSLESHNYLTSGFVQEPQLRRHGEHVIVRTKVCKDAEAATRGQSASPTWFAFRAGRVTASTAHAACRTTLTQPSVSLVKKICYPEESKFSSPATNWGLRKEDIARNQYVAEASSQHKEFVCNKSGLHISSHEPHMAASPDGLISCACCQDGVLEIKCPYSAACVKDVVTQKSGCLEVAASDNTLKLKRQHAYYTQIQMQLFVCQRSYCDFFVWTPADSHLERIFLDAEFCQGVVNRSRDFFKIVLLPELLFKTWTTSSENKNGPEDSSDDGALHFCYCGGPESGDMVECSGPDCEVHARLVGNAPARAISTSGHDTIDRCHEDYVILAACKVVHRLKCRRGEDQALHVPSAWDMLDPLVTPIDVIALQMALPNQELRP